MVYFILSIRGLNSYDPIRINQGFSARQTLHPSYYLPYPTLPYPTDYALTYTFRFLPEGGRILRPEGYVPLLYLGRSRSSPDEEDALTYLCASDHHSGRVLLLHYDVGVKHCPDPNTFPIDTRNIDFLQNKPRSDEGRGVIKLWTNCDSKRSTLDRDNGPIVYPAIPISFYTLSYAIRRFWDMCYTSVKLRWFKHYRIAPQDVGLSTYGISIHGQRMIAFPLTEQFGSQD